MTRVYNYWPKNTSARTQYCEIDEKDLAEIKLELIRWMARISTLDSVRDEDWRLVREQYFHRRSKHLPKGRDGENTPSSFIGGIVLNTMFGEQRDLSRSQLEGIETISRAMNQLWDDCSVLQFRIGVFG